MAPLQGHRTKVAKEDQATAILKLTVLLELTAVLEVHSVRGVTVARQSAMRQLQETITGTVDMVAMERTVKMVKMARMAMITRDLTPMDRMA